MNNDNLTEKTNIIIENLNLLDNNISKIKKKIASINKIYKELENNNILVINKTNNYLIFQIQILRNECNYYKNLYYIILNKYSNEIYDLSEYIIMILLSLNKIEIGNKEHIFNKIIHVKKVKNINYGKLNETINSTINNLKLIDEFVILFNKYIENTISKNKKNNIHNNSYESTIKNKKETILLEYNKNYNKFITNIDYFKTCLESIIQQIDTSNLLKFFLNDKSI